MVLQSASICCLRKLVATCEMYHAKSRGFISSVKKSNVMVSGVRNVQCALSYSSRRSSEKCAVVTAHVNLLVQRWGRHCKGMKGWCWLGWCSGRVKITRFRLCCTGFIRVACRPVLFGYKITRFRCSWGCCSSVMYQECLLKHVWIVFMPQCVKYPWCTWCVVAPILL